MDSQVRTSIPQATNQCVDPSDLEFFDFNSFASSAPSSSKNAVSQPIPNPALTSPITGFIPLDINEERPAPIQPSHEYGRFKQTTGLPPTSFSHSDGSSRYGFNTGFSDSFLIDGMDSQTGMGSVMSDMTIELDSSSPMYNDFSEFDLQAMYREQEAQANVRIYPGMHSQAALAKQAQQQKQQQLLQQQRMKQREAESSNPRRRSAGPVDARTEETIARVVAQIRQNSNASGSGDSVSPNATPVLPHIIKTRKDEEDMDEDERLLNSEEGKKLSSKERRQLRNKVSARAFRSRRKEYIGQLEGEVAVKTNEANELKRQNQALVEENARFRTLAERLLAHPAFHPFLDELSRDPALSESLSKVTNPSARPSETPTPSASKDVNPYAANLQRYSSQQNENMHVNMVTIPEQQLDLSSLNLGGNSNWAAGAMGMHNFQQTHVFAVTSLPEPPQPIDSAELSGKGDDNILERLEGKQSVKSDYPELEFVPEVEEASVEAEALSQQPAEVAEPDFDPNDPLTTLYASETKLLSSPPVDESEVFEPLFGEIPSEKVFSHLELYVTSEEDEVLPPRFEKMLARMEATCKRLENLTVEFGGLE